MHAISLITSKNVGALLSFHLFGFDRVPFSTAETEAGPAGEGGVQAEEAAVERPPLFLGEKAPQGTPASTPRTMPNCMAV